MTVTSAAAFTYSQDSKTNILPFNNVFAIMSHMNIIPSTYSHTYHLNARTVSIILLRGHSDVILGQKVMIFTTEQIIDKNVITYKWLVEMELCQWHI